MAQLNSDLFVSVVHFSRHEANDTVPGCPQFSLEAVLAQTVLQRGQEGLPEGPEVLVVEGVQVGVLLPDVRQEGAELVVGRL